MSLSKQNKYYLGVDIGTTSTKAVLFGQRGQMGKTFQKSYPLITDLTGKAEQNPDEILQAVKEVMGAAFHSAKENKQTIIGVGFSAAMHSLLCLDENRHVLHPLITWADTRAQKQVEALGKRADISEICARTGVPNHPMTPLSKVCYLREEHPTLFAQTRYFVGIKEYVLGQLTNHWMVDESLAASTGYYHLQNHDWDEELLSLASINRKQLSEIVPSTTQLSLSEAMLAEWQLAESPQIIVGASDGVLSNLGIQESLTNQLVITVGTSGAVRKIIETKTPQASQGLFLYPLAQDFFVEGGAVNNGGVIFQWLKEQFFAGKDYPSLLQKMTKVPAGSHGLLVLPHFFGERAPYFQANLRGNILGLNHNHTKEDILKATMEGIILNLRKIVQRLDDKYGPSKQICLTGGMTNNTVIPQLFADICQKEIVVTDCPESSCKGAAMLAMKACDKLTAFPAWSNSTHIYTPDETCAAIYNQLDQLFLQAVPQILSINQQLTHFQQHFS